MGKVVQSKKPRLRKVLIVVCLFAAVLLLLVLVNFIPTFYLKNPGMNTRQGEYITVYYEKEEAAAREVFSLTESESRRFFNRFWHG
jgi:hypothetical protein